MLQQLYFLMKLMLWEEEDQMDKISQAESELFNNLELKHSY
jgi:hypothetical protein